MQKITGQAIANKKASTKIVNAFLKVTLYKYNLNNIMSLSSIDIITYK